MAGNRYLLSLAKVKLLSANIYSFSSSQIREYAKGLPMLNGELVEEEEADDGSLWREEKKKVGQGGGILETSYIQPGGGNVGQEGGILETYIQPGGGKRSIVVEEEENGDGEDFREEQMRIGPSSFYFDNDKGGEIAKRAWNSYFTGGFGKRSINTGDTGNTGNTGNTGEWEKAKVILRPMRSLPALPGAFSLFTSSVTLSFKLI